MSKKRLTQVNNKSKKIRGVITSRQIASAIAGEIELLEE